MTLNFAFTPSVKNLPLHLLDISAHSRYPAICHASTLFACILLQSIGTHTCKFLVKRIRTVAQTSLTEQGAVYSLKSQIYAHDRSGVGNLFPMKGRFDNHNPLAGQWRCRRWEYTKLPLWGVGPGASRGHWWGPKKKKHAGLGRRPRSSGICIDF